MTDTISKKKRSEIMSAIRSKDSKMELSLRKELTRAGLKYRKNVASLEGKPDIAFIGEKVAVFLDSCFWHGCKTHCRLPQTNRGYWKKKIERNKKRDREVDKIYKNKNWKVLRFWEHELKKSASAAKHIIRVLEI